MTLQERLRFEATALRTKSMPLSYLIPLLQEAADALERYQLQAAGAHPAPCARSCEASAFRAEIRSLKAQVLALKGAP